MDIYSFKTSLFGYNKMEVCTYIAKLGDEYYQKLQANWEEYDKSKKELLSQIEKLRKNNQKDEENSNQLLNESQAAYELQKERIAAYEVQLNDLLKMLQTVLENVKSDISPIADDMRRLKEKSDLTNG